MLRSFLTHPQILPAQFSKYLSVAEVTSLIQGPPSLNIEDMKKQMKYLNGYHSNTPVIKWFWDIVSSWPYSQQQKLLLFWSGSAVPPLYGFSSKFNVDGEGWAIQKARMSSTSLPLASTCTYLLKLPPYGTREILRAKLQLALEFGSQGYNEAWSIIQADICVCAMYAFILQIGAS